MIRECYGKLRELIAWGYLVSAVWMGAGQLNRISMTPSRKLAADLQDGDLDGFAAGWQSFIESRMNLFHSKFPFQEQGRAGTAGPSDIEERRYEGIQKTFDFHFSQRCGSVDGEHGIYVFLLNRITDKMDQSSNERMINSTRIIQSSVRRQFRKRRGA